MVTTGDSYYIGNSAFHDAKSLTAINVDADNASFTSVDGVLFSKDGKTLYFYPRAKAGAYEVKNTVEVIYENAFRDTTALTSVTFEAGTEASKPLTINTGASNGAFSNSSVTSITLPSRVSEVAGYLFNGAKSLTTVVLPDTITSIGNRAFYNCTALNSFTFGSGDKLTSIGSDAFYGASSLESLAIPASVTTIGSAAFNGMSSLTSITFGTNSKLGAIANNTFWNCSKLESIVIPANVASIGTAFNSRCSKLKSVSFEAGSKITSITSGIFTSLNIEEFSFPDNVKTVGASLSTSSPSNVFNNCKNLKKVVLPKNLTTFFAVAFGGCSALETLELDASNTHLR